MSEVSPPEIERPRLLIVDDVPANIDVLREILRFKYKITAATSGVDALRMVRKSPPDLILLDIVMPEMDGYAVLQRLQSSAKTRKIPVIFVTASGEAANEERGLSMGAADFMTKPVVPAIARARVRAHIALYDQTRLLESLVADRTRQLRKEMAAREEVIERVRYLRSYNVISGLPNRELFTEKLESDLQTDGQGLAVAFLELDRFDSFTDALGSEAGDALMRQISVALTESVGEQDFLAHLGVDQFAVVMRDTGSDGSGTGAAKRVNRILERISRSYEVQEVSVDAHFSVGLALCPLDGNTPTALLKNAEAAMNFAKKDIGTQICFYSAEMNAQSRELLALEAEFRNALAAGEVVPWYQPKVDTQSFQICGAEALARWKDADDNMVSPFKFVLLAEQSGLIRELTTSILHRACTDAARWVKAYGDHLKIAVNLSAADFQFSGLLADIEAILKDTGLAAKHLELEITEQAIIKNPEAAAEQIDVLRGHGISLALDDFGTGYSSLSYLRRFRFDILKVDRSFVNCIDEDEPGEAITRTILQLGKDLRLNTVGEGVETDEQLRFLQNSGCDQIQGFLFSPAVATAEFDNFLAQGQLQPKHRAAET